MKLEGTPERVERTPMILRITKNDLLEIVNRERQRTGLNPLPVQECEVTVAVPGGGDWSNMDLEIGNRDNLIDIRWRE